MIQVGRDDLLRALKRFKGIAKQDLLVNDPTPKSDFLKAHAEARRETYTKLIDLVEESGIENACAFAFTEYQKLPLLDSEAAAEPVAKGHLQALEMFFNVIGIEADKLRGSRVERINLSQLLNLSPQPQNDWCAQN
jgi:hypothetical protein